MPNVFEESDFFENPQPKATPEVKPNEEPTEKAEAEETEKKAEAEETQPTEEPAGDEENTEEEVGEETDKDEPEEEEEEEKKESEEEEEEEEEEVTLEHPYLDKMKEAFPDREFKSTDDVAEAYDEYVSGLEDFKKRGVETNQALIDLFDSNPEVANIMKDMTKGASLRAAIARHIDMNDLKPEEGDPDYDEWKKNQEARLKQLKDEQERQQTLKKNMSESNNILVSFAKENKLSDKEAEGLVNLISDMSGEFLQGILTKDSLNRFLKAYRYDQDLKEAETTGEKRGKNAKITEMRSQENKQKKGDGLPKVQKIEQRDEPSDPALKKIKNIADRSVQRDVWR